MKETIFYLEGRGGMYLYHFFVYNLGGLFYILNEKYNIRIPNTLALLQDKCIIVNSPSTEIKFPIKIYMNNILPFQREAFEIIKDKFELIENLNNIADYEIVCIYGETCQQNPYSDNPNIIFPFLRNLFYEKCNYKLIKGKRIFITRKNSETQHNGILKRYILNENDLKNMLNKYNFEFIQLEDYNTNDKIKLFMESEVIVSSHSGSLTFLLFANINTKIIEILNKGTNGFPHDHYINISNVLNLNYNRYSNIYEDQNGNFNINLNSFEKYILSLL
jgi:capsular polysaccharide biosynthesis protein